MSTYQPSQNKRQRRQLYQRVTKDCCAVAKMPVGRVFHHRPSKLLLMKYTPSLSKQGQGPRRTDSNNTFDCTATICVLRPVELRLKLKKEDILHYLSLLLKLVDRGEYVWWIQFRMKTTAGIDILLCVLPQTLPSEIKNTLSRLLELVDRGGHMW